MLQRIVSILWPSFLVAGVADVIFTTLFDPLDLMYRGEALFENRIAAYTVDFFIFWLIGISSSMLTCYFQRTSDEINRCALPACKPPQDSPKREGGSDCC